MNCPLATSRLFIGTLHQVHRRSGISDAGDAGAVGLVDMAALSPSTKNLVNRDRMKRSRKIFSQSPMQMKKIVV